MRLLFRSIRARLAKDPLRAALAAVIIALGCATFVITVNIARASAGASRLGFDIPGTRFMIANGTVGVAGHDPRDIEFQNNPEFAGADVLSLERALPAIKAMSPVLIAGNPAMEAAGRIYRSAGPALAVGPQYPLVYELAMVQGSFFSPDDLAQARTVVVLSDAGAKTLFGSAEAALGKTLTVFSGRGGPADQPERGSSPGQDGGTANTVLTVVGVYADPPREQKDTYEIADVLVPYTLFPSARRVEGQFVVLSSNTNAPAAEADLEAVLRAQLGASLDLLAWEGRPQTYENTVDEAKRGGRIVSIVFVGLGLITLLVSAIGIFSMTMVSALERTREIGLRRTIGATRSGVVGLLLGEAVAVAAVGAAVGVVVALLFNGKALLALGPLINSARFPQGGAGPGLSLGPLLIGVAATLGCGALFGLFPAASAARVSPSESLRES